SSSRLKARPKSPVRGNSTNSRYFTSCRPYTRATPSWIAMTVPTLAVAVVLVPKPVMFFSMMAVISSAQEAIVFLLMYFLIKRLYLPEPVPRQGKNPPWLLKYLPTIAVGEHAGGSVRYYQQSGLPHEL